MKKQEVGKKRSKYYNRAVELYKEHKSSEIVASKISKEFGVRYSGTLARKIRSWVSELGLTKSNKNKIEDSSFFKEAKKRLPNVNKCYFITSAQNATPVHKKLWKNIKKYSEYRESEVVVIPIRYKNPTSLYTDLTDDYWDPKVVDHLMANKHDIHKYVTVIGDLKIQPTAVTPLTGLEGFTGESSTIVGHTRQHFKVCPTLEGQPPKFIATTGAVTNKNYTDSKAGKKGEFHHTFGFTIVEILDDFRFIIRQVEATEDGSFCDLDVTVSGGHVVQNNKNIDALVLGDLHLGKTCEVSLNTTRKMIDVFNPEHIVLHDIIEGYSVSHHEKKDPFIALERELDGSWDMEKEIENALCFLKDFEDRSVCIVKSNHDIFIDRFLLDSDWRKEKNKYAYLKYAKLKADGELPNGILPYNVKQRYSNVTCLTEDDSYVVNGVELGVHGHIGAKGSRGTPLQYKRLNIPMVTGHTHSPLKMDNHVTVGTLTKLRMGYNKGMNDWFNSNVIVHNNGKNQILLIWNGDYTCFL